MKPFGLLYDLGLHLYACASIPKIISQFGKYRNNCLPRLGFGFPKIDKKGKKLVWIHAVSFGETKAVEPLIKKFKAQDNPPLILLSSTTETGHQEGLKNSAADFHVYLPFDFSYVICPIMKRVAPDLVILTETDFWYHFQTAAKKEGAQLVVINGKISERSFKRLSKVPFLAKRLLGPIDHFYVQGEHYLDRFAGLKIPPSKITITGNVKLDSDPVKENPALLKVRLGLQNETVLTLGSTHDPEEKIWIKALKSLWEQFPTLKVLLVPRHPERFNDVAKLLASEQIPFSRWSEEGKLDQKNLLLVDTMGVLRSCYQISDLTFVGGTFAPKVGGHNILEPAFYAKPVLFGPHMHSQPDFLDLVKNYNAGIQVTEETLLPTLENLLKNPANAQTLGQNGQKLITSSRGALNHTFNALLPLLQKDSI